MNKDLNPERVAFFEGLAKVAPVEVMQGPFWELFPHAKIVINQTVKGDLNFRVFEAMMSGSVLLTEEGPNGLCDLFTPDVHMVTYRKNDIADAARKINELLECPKRCQRIGAAGRAEILARHTEEHRAARLLTQLNELQPLNRPISYYAQLHNAHWLYIKVMDLDTEIAKRSLSHSIKLLEKGLAAAEPLLEKEALLAVFFFLQLDRWQLKDMGEALILEFSKQYPDAQVFYLAYIWKLLNQGKLEEAEKLTRALPSDNVQQTYHNINNLINGLLYPNL